MSTFFQWFFRKTTSEENSNHQRLNMFKQHMNEIVDQGFKDTAMNQINFTTE